MASLVGVGVSITLSCPAITALAMTFGGGGDEDNVHVGMKEGGQLGREKKIVQLYTIHAGLKRTLLQRANIISLMLKWIIDFTPNRCDCCSVC